MKTMFRAFAALALACLFAGPAAAACEPGKSLADITEVAVTLVERGDLDDVLILDGDGLAAYVKTLNGLGLAIPDTITKIVVAIRHDKSAVIFGFIDGCINGQAQLPPGIHQRAYGAGA